MALMIIVLVLILMWKLNDKGLAYREEKRTRAYHRRIEERREKMLHHEPLTDEEIAQMKRDAKEAEYRKDLEKQGYPEHLIATILPTLMSEEK